MCHNITAYMVRNYVWT